MNSPHRMKNTRVTIRLPENLTQHIDTIVEKKHKNLYTSRNHFIVSAIHSLIQNLRKSTVLTMNPHQKQRTQGWRVRHDKRQ